MPLQFDGVRITSAAQLARLIDRTPEDTAKGLRLMQQGWLRAWLVGSGRVTDTRELDHALLSFDVSPESKLETVLHLLDLGMGRPCLELSAETLHVGRLTLGDVRVRELHI